MTLVFTPCSGAVAVARAGCTSADVFSIKIAGEEINAITTSMSLELSGNYQFLHTVNNFIYFYSFGDRVGTLSVSGIGFVNKCPNTSKGLILDVYQYYLNHRAVKQAGKSYAITLTSGGTTKTLYGFLTGARIDVADGPYGILGNWTLKFEVVIPQTD